MPMTEEIKVVEVLIRADQGDGNDPFDATARLPKALIAKGVQINVWIDYTKTDRGFSTGGEEVFLTIKEVVLCAYAPERIEVWISTDGISDSYLKDIMEAIERDDQP